MVQDIPPPPEARVIRLAREATGMTAQAAAYATKALDPSGKGVSAPYWRDTEHGFGYRRGVRVPSRASDRVLALMARVVGVQPRQLAEAGREDAAEVLEAALRRDKPAPAPVTPQPQLPFPVPVSLAERRAARQLKAMMDAAFAEPVEQILAEAATQAGFPRDQVEAQIWALKRLPEQVRAEFIAQYRLGQAAQGKAGYA